MKRIYRFLAIGLVLVVLGAGYFFTNLTIFDRTFIQLNTSQKNQANKLGFSYLFFVSRTIVTGPSLTSSTCISAPKTPVSTGTSLASSWLKS